MDKRIQDLKDKNILILGFAREGLSVAKFLKKYFPEKPITIRDQAPKEHITQECREFLRLNKNLDVKYSVGDWKQIKDWDSFDLIVKSAGIPLKNLPDEIKPKLTSETQIFFDLCPGEVVGVTGTKGKSTTSTLIYETFIASNKKAVLIGNIGRPALDYLDQIDQSTMVIYELSSHQLQTLTVSPHVSIFLNIYPEHLDYYESFEDYLSSKAHITTNQTDRDFLIFNQDFPEISAIASKSKATKIPIGQIQAQQLLPLIKTSKLQGNFNALNVLAAQEVVRLFQIDLKKFASVVRDFKPLEHRLENLGEFKGVKFYNDSLATIPEATIAALETLGGNVETIILGGLDRGVDYSALAKKVISSSIKNLILFPTTGQKIWGSMIKLDSEVSKRFEVVDVKDMETAVKYAFQHTSQGKITLLSCASTSFNLFKDYKDRGDQFKFWVEKLGK